MWRMSYGSVCYGHAQRITDISSAKRNPTSVDCSCGKRWANLDRDFRKIKVGDKVKVVDEPKTNRLPGSITGKIIYTDCEWDGIHGVCIEAQDSDHWDAYYEDIRLAE